MLNPVNRDSDCAEFIHHCGYRALPASAEDGAVSRRLWHGKASSSVDEKGKPLAVIKARDLYVIGGRWTKHAGTSFTVCLQIDLPPDMFSGGRPAMRRDWVVTDGN